MSKEQIFDELYGQIASRANGLDELLTTFLGFLHRKTDFYIEIPPGKKSNMGFHPNEAEQILIKTFRKYKMKTIASMGPVTTTNPNNPTKPNKPANTTTSIENSSRIEILEDSSVDNSNSIGNGNKLSNTNTNTTSTVSTNNNNNNNNTNHANKSNKSDIKYNSDGKQIPMGNGGICDNYYWTQSLHDLTIYLDLPYNTKSKELECKIKPNNIHISINTNTSNTTGNKNALVLLSGKLDNVIIIDDCMWTINTNTYSKYTQMILTFDKSIHTWWKCIIQGDIEIDTTKVDSNMKICEYDEETHV